MFDAFYRTLLEGRLRSQVHNQRLGDAHMMGDMVNYRPRCCACLSLATGRVCYMNGKGESSRVVDNPFCDKCYDEVYKQTLRLLKTLYKDDEIAGDWIWTQRWFVYQVIPRLPSGLPMLVDKGERVRK